MSGGTSGLYGKSSPERGTFFGFRFIKWYGFYLLKYRPSAKRPERSFYGSEKVDKTFPVWFLIYSNLKEGGGNLKEDSR